MSEAERLEIREKSAKAAEDRRKAVPSVTQSWSENSRLQQLAEERKAHIAEQQAKREAIYKRTERQELERKARWQAAAAAEKTWMAKETEEARVSQQAAEKATEQVEEREKKAAQREEIEAIREERKTRQAVQDREDKWMAKVAQRAESGSSSFYYQPSSETMEKPFSSLQKAISQKRGLNSQLSGMDSKMSNSSIDKDPSTNEGDEQKVSLPCIANADRWMVCVRCFSSFVPV